MDDQDIQQSAKSQPNPEINQERLPFGETLEKLEERQLEAILPKDEWHQRLEQEVELAQASGKSLSVIFTDINRLKTVNDSLGHIVGDDVIEDKKKLLAEIASGFRITNGRKGDIVSYGQKLDAEEEVDDMQAGRLGGDEFGVICLTDEAGTEVITERIREAFDSYINQDDKKQLKDLGMGIAIGAATLQPWMSASDLLRAADVAMYADKEAQKPSPGKVQKVGLLMAKGIFKLTGVKPEHLPKR